MTGEYYLEVTTIAEPEFTAGQAYPTYAQSIDSTEDVYDELISDRTTAGLLKTRSIVPSENIKRIFTVIHPSLTLVERTWLLDFYKKYRDSYFQFTWKADNETYWVQFTDRPKITIIGGNWWKATVSLAEVALGI